LRFGCANFSTGGPTLAAIIDPLLAAWKAVRDQIAVPNRRLITLAKGNPTCRLLMTCPGIGVIVATSFAAAIEALKHVRHSRSVGPYLGLTPSRYQSGETEPRPTDAVAGVAINRLRKKSPFACFEGGLIAAMKADLACERAVWGAFGGASAEGGIHFAETLPGEAYPVRTVAAVEIAADRTEDELATSLRLEGDVGGLEHVYELGVPQLHLGDPPPSEQWVLARGHQVASSLGMRIRL
jgi:hypothetical protein